MGKELLPAVRSSRSGPPDGEKVGPLVELRERYGRGEIDDDEFERRVERLVATENTDFDFGDAADFEPADATDDRERETVREQ